MANENHNAFEVPNNGEVQIEDEAISEVINAELPSKALEEGPVDCMEIDDDALAGGFIELNDLAGEEGFIVLNAVAGEEVFIELNDFTGEGGYIELNDLAEPFPGNNS